MRPSCSRTTAFAATAASIAAFLALTGIAVEYLRHATTESVAEKRAT